MDIMPSQWVCRMACAAMVSIGQKGSTLREDVKTHSYSLLQFHKDMRETAYLFPTCKDNNSGLNASKGQNFCGWILIGWLEICAAGHSDSHWEILYMPNSCGYWYLILHWYMTHVFRHSCTCTIPKKPIPGQPWRRDITSISSDWLT